MSSVIIALDIKKQKLFIPYDQADLLPFIESEEEAIKHLDMYYPGCKLLGLLSDPTELIIALSTDLKEEKPKKKTRPKQK